MGEVLILIIIALVWGFKAAVANEDKKVNDRETGSISSTPDELIKKANRTLDDLDTMRAKERESKKRPSGVQIRDFHKNLAAQERKSSEKRWEIAQEAGRQRRGAFCPHGQLRGPARKPEGLI